MNIKKISALILVSSLFLAACANGQNGTTTIKTPDIPAVNVPDIKVPNVNVPGVTNTGQNSENSSASSSNQSNNSQNQTSVADQTIPSNNDNVSLTDQQKIQLKAGEESHNPKTLTFDVTAGSYYFVPNTIKVKKGDTVKINLKNMNGLHNFYLDEFNVKSSNINSDETTSVQFVADKTGSFEFYCSIGNHRQMGMTGTLIVE